MTDFLYGKELQLIKEALAKQGKSKEFKTASAEAVSYLKETGMPEAVVHFFQQAEPVDGIDLDGSRLWPVSELKIENEDAVPGYIIYPLGYRIIGSTVYGDVYCINLNSIDPHGQPEVYLASHDEIYEDMSTEEIKAGVVKIAATFREFLQKYSEGSLPKDFYELKAP